VTLDNYGSELTGSVVAGVHLEKSNLLGLGERVYTDLRHYEDDLWSAAIGARIPLAIHNLMLDLSYLHSENDIGDRLAFLNASGETDILTAGLSSNLVNMRTFKWDVGTGLEVRKHESFLANVTDTKDDIRKAYLSSSILSNNQNRVLLASFKVRRGVDLFGASEEDDAGLSRVQGNPDAFIFEPLFYANVRSPITDGDFKAQVSGQLASNTLLSSDLFTLGGYGSVRGFEPAQETGEAGYQFSGEYNHNIRIPAIPEVAFRAGPFLDGGAVFNRLAGQTQDTHLYSAGLGLEADADLIAAGKTRLRLDFAHTIGDYDSNQVQGESGFFRLSQAF
jgi:hemolysin activation/secretion protein